MRLETAVLPEESTRDCSGCHVTDTRVPTVCRECSPVTVTRAPTVCREWSPMTDTRVPTVCREWSPVMDTRAPTVCRECSGILGSVSEQTGYSLCHL